MPDLDFQIERAEAVRFAAVPTIAFELTVKNADACTSIHSVALHCQIQIEAPRRQYAVEDKNRLRDLFGEPDRWSQTLRNLLWTHCYVNVPSFQLATVIDLPVACTFDFNVASTKYFYGLSEGEVPLCFQFSGTVLYANADGNMQMAPISWEKEARFRMPVTVWRDMMDAHYPGVAWLSLRRDVFERLYDYKVRNGIPTWEDALESMLAAEHVQL